MKRFGSNACVFDTLDSVLEDNDNNLVAVGKYEKPCPKYKCHHGYACGDVWFLKVKPAMAQKYSKRDMLTKDQPVATACLNSMMGVLLSEEE